MVKVCCVKGCQSESFANCGISFHRAKHIKQVATAPTKSGLKDRTRIPGPMEYDLPNIVGGKGYNTIGRAPAYTFGIKHKQIEPYKGGGNSYNICGFTNKGKNRITYSVISPRLDPPASKDRLPGPAEYLPDLKVHLKRPPAYTMLPRCRDKYDSGTMWTPPPNMYYPPVKGKKPPAFSLIGKLPPVKEHCLPGPSDYDPNFHYVRQTIPKFTIRRKVELPEKLFPSPAPNEYCSKRFNVTYPRQGGHSFGIRHSPFIGTFPTYTKSSKLDLTGTS